MSKWGQQALDECVDLISVHDSYGVYLYANEGFRRFLGHDPDALVGRAAYEFFHPDDIEAISASHEATLYEGQPSVVVYRIQRADGGYEWVETTSRTVKPDGSRGTIYTVTRPVVGRRPTLASHAWLADARRAFEP